MEIVIRTHEDGRRYQAIVDGDGTELAQYNMAAALELVATADRRNSATAKAVPGVKVTGK